MAKFFWLTLYIYIVHIFDQRMNCEVDDEYARSFYRTATYFAVRRQQQNLTTIIRTTTDVHIILCLLL